MRVRRSHVSRGAIKRGVRSLPRVPPEFHFDRSLGGLRGRSTVAYARICTCREPGDTLARLSKDETNPLRGEKISNAAACGVHSSRVNETRPPFPRLGSPCPRQDHSSRARTVSLSQAERPGAYLVDSRREGRLELSGRESRFQPQISTR